MSVLNWGRLRDQCLVGLSVIAFFWVASQVVGRVLHIVVVVLLALGLLAVGILIIGPPTIQQSEAVAERLPGYLDQFRRWVDRRRELNLEDWLDRLANGWLWVHGLAAALLFALVIDHVVGSIRFGGFW